MSFNVFALGRPRARRTSFQVGRGFTLIELLVSITVLVVLMLVVTQVIGIVQRNWVRANSRVSQFREARRAFEVLSRNLSQATLNTYWANDFEQIYTDNVGEVATAPKSYKRQSELQFVCGPTPMVLAGTGGNDYPGHAVFFQAPLGVTNLYASDEGGTTANTENMVNLLCARGYFVEWGTDTPFRPPFLAASPYTTTVPARARLRLMEYSPTAEQNRIYAELVRPITEHSKQWFQDALTNVVKQNETVRNRAFTRPIAENILALVISPQLETTGNLGVTPTSIAPNYYYDSTVVGPAASGTNPQGTQHLLPPLLKVTMIALDERSGEFFAQSTNTALRSDVLGKAAALFKTASNFAEDLDGTDDEPGELEKTLLQNKLNYRVFSTTIALKQSRWSF